MDCKRILVIEDDPAIRSVLRTLLESQHYRVVEAESAARGSVEARGHKPDLIIVDLGLPDRDGIAVIREIRSQSPVPILVLTAQMATGAVDEDEIASAVAAHDLVFTEKPVRMSILSASLARALSA